MEQIIGADPLVIVGGFGLNFSQYEPLRRHLAALSGRPVSITSLTPFDWLGVIASKSYGALLRILDRAVRAALNATSARRVTLVAHSAGGVLARIYLGDQPYGPRRLVYSGFEHVGALVTLGTPHWTTHTGRHGGLDQVRFVQRIYPGAYWRTVRYVSVMGRGVFGAQAGSPAERTAYQNYSLLSGDGAQWGDGVIPLQSGLLEGSRHVVLAGLRHDGRAAQPWYGGSTELVRTWWQQVEAAERE